PQLGVVHPLPVRLDQLLVHRYREAPTCLAGGAHAEVRACAALATARLIVSRHPLVPLAPPEQHPRWTDEGVTLGIVGEIFPPEPRLPALRVRTGDQRQ